MNDRHTQTSINKVIILKGENSERVQYKTSLKFVKTNIAHKFVNTVKIVEAQLDKERNSKVQSQLEVTIMENIQEHEELSIKQVQNVGKENMMSNTIKR